MWSFSQVTTLASWNFEDNDSIVDIAITANITTTIDKDQVTTGLTYSYSDGYNGGSAFKCNKFHSTAGEQFWKTEISTSGYSNIKVSSVQSGSSASAPRDFQLQYSLDNLSWNNIGSTIVVAEDWAGGVVDNVILPAECDNQSVLYIRWLRSSEIGIGGGALAWGSSSLIDNIVITGEILSTNDNDSELTSGSDAEPTSISSIETLADGVQVLDFIIEDIGGDGVATIVNSLIFQQGSNNQIADWTNVIAGAKLFDEDIAINITPVINSSSIVFDDISIFSVENGTTKSFQLKIWLKEDLSDINDNDNLDFQIDFEDIVCDYTGSSIGSGSVESGMISIDIEATELSFVFIPTMVAINQNFSLSVVSTDGNGNLDTDNTNSVSLSLNTGTGNLSSATGLTQNLVSGVYNWTDLQYDELEEFSIDVTSSGLTTTTTNNIICAEFVSYLNDDFEDGDILGWTESEIGHWSASDLEPINGNYSLHQTFNASTTVADRISHPITGLDVEADSTIWMFEVKYTNSSPSSSNNWNVFIMADSDYSEMQNGGNINGYVIGVNFQGYDDLLKLWSVTNGTPTEIISTSYDWNNVDEEIAKSFIVARSTSGAWEIYIDEDGGFDNLISYGTGIESTNTIANYFGILYNYTSSNDRNLWFDDIYVGPPIPDTDAPWVYNISVNSPNTLILTFNEDIDDVTSEVVTNYSVDNSIGNPSSAVRNSLNHREIDLTFDSDFAENIDYQILVENIEDISGNAMQSQILDFQWQNIAINSVRIVSSNELKVVFSKEIDSTSAVQLSNYTIDNSIGNPTSIIFNETERNIVNIIFEDDFNNEVTYNLHIENIEDVFGNIITPTDYEFIFYIVQRFDVIINELMVDINPAPVALPANKYIEIYNTSNFDIDLSGWTLTIGTNNPIEFPQTTIISNSYAIICSEEMAENFSAYGNVIPILTESYLTSTSGKQINLKNSSDDIIEQIFYYPDSWYQNEDKDDGGWAMERIDPTNFCNQTGNWRASENYIGGTPSMLNSVFGNNPDTQPPYIEGFSFITSCDILIDFSETVDTLSSNSIINYILNTNTIPFIASIDDEDNSIVKLHFLEHFAFGQNELVVSNISDYCGNVMTDSSLNFSYQLIYPLDVETKSATQLKIYFSEPVDKNLAENILNYSVNNEIGNPIVATRDINDTNIVHLLFEVEFQENTVNTLTISELTDNNGNNMEQANISFTYYVPKPFDIVINEMMLDVNPVPLGLPETQYIELFNTTNYDIWLSDWSLIPESQSNRIFPSVKIESNGFLILCNENNEKLFKNYGTTVPIIGSSDLSQSGKELQITDNYGNLIYHVNYSDTWYNDENKEDGGWSLEKIDPFNFCESRFNWAASNDITGGTPGKINSIFSDNPDTVGIELYNVIVKSSNKLAIQFTKNVSYGTGLDVLNYSVEGIGNPISVNLSDTSYSTVVLYFDNQFNDEQEYSLVVNGVSDDCGNTITNDSYSFIYYLIHPEYVWVLNENQLQIKFSEEVDYTTALNANNYIVNNQVGTPTSIIRGTEDPSMIFLQFSTDFTDGATYELSVSNLKDVNGNVMEDATLEFVFYKAKVNDIVINEVLFNPYSGGVDFVELFNRSIYPINMLDLRIAKRDAETGEIENQYRISEYNYLLQPEEYLVITTDTITIQETYNYGENFIEINTMPSYPDDKGTVVIYDEKDTIIDEFSYFEDIHFGLISDANGVSLERIDYNKPTQDTSNWHSAAESVGFATPGLVNSQYKSIDSSAFSGNIELEPQVFSPDNDGYNDQLYINYQFDNGGYAATIQIFDKNGREVKELTNNELIGTSGYWIWDGLDDYGLKARVGMYIIFIKIFDLEGNIEIYKKTAVVAAMKN